jgi:hypothetical protein
MPSRDYPAVHGPPPDNAEIARQLDAFASLLELAGADPREISPAGLGRFLGVSVKRMLEIGRVLGVRTLEVSDGPYKGTSHLLPTADSIFGGRACL